MKVTELTKEQLNHWVARAQGWKLVPAYNHDGEQIGEAWEGEGVYISPASDYAPTNNWQQAGALIDKTCALFTVRDGEIWASILNGEGFGPNHSRAVCMAVVVREYGEEVTCHT